MQKVGIDLGTSTIKIVVIENNQITSTWLKPHHGQIIESLKAGLKALTLDKEFNLALTGANRKLVLSRNQEIAEIEEIPAIVEGTKFVAKEVNSIIEIGSQSARYISDIHKEAPQFSINEHCAGGTGSFFEDQMSRLNLKLEDYSKLVANAQSIPNLSGRCAVFAKTDIIHLQQEGIFKQDILLGLCYAMIRNYKATIVKTLPIKKPIAFCGGVSLNIGVIQALKAIFKLDDDELIIPKEARTIGAIGAALAADKTISLKNLIDSLDNDKEVLNQDNLDKLNLKYNLNLVDPEITELMPKEGAYLGIDVGSTSTDLVLISKDNELIDFLYLRTAGDPESVVRKGMQNLKAKYGDFKVLAVGITGSGRERLGHMMKADAIKDEITAQAKAAAHFMPEVDTVFEIGGQDSKFIEIKDGEVVDFQMNKICAAGTGSFIEEQASRMNIDINDFGELALNSLKPCDLGERCTVFIETAIVEEEAKGASVNDIAAGLCHSIVKNYLHKVVAAKHIGEHIILQGGVNYNPGIVAAFEAEFGSRVKVSPVFSISGAYGVALIAKESVKDQASTFLGFDFPTNEKQVVYNTDEIRRNKAFYRKAGQLAYEDYDATIDPNKKTIGIPLTLIMFKFFPLANAFFKSLGYNVILSHPSNEETIELAQNYAHGETCYPVKLLYGHMMELSKRKVDYIFLPRIHTIRHPHSHAVHNYACPYMQTAATTIFNDLKLAEQGIELLSPILDLDLGAQMMGVAMLETGKHLGFAKPRCMPGLIKGALAVKKYSSGVEEMGRELLANLKPDDKVLVLITRNYGISDPILNMGIPEILLAKGYKVLTLGHLPGMDLDLSKDYPNMYWPFGDHLLSGAKLIANHPNLYAVYLTNHGCGPDTIISHMFKEEMGDKPYLQIEVDEHYSKVGVITRIEAFLNGLSHRPKVQTTKNFNILDVKMKATKIIYKPLKDKTLLIPDIGLYTKYLVVYFNELGYKAKAMPKFDHESLKLGRAQMNSKEYLGLAMLVGSAIRAIKESNDETNLQFLVPYTYGADADGQYPRALRTILDRIGYVKCEIVAPILEEVSEKADDIDLLLRALLTADILYAMPLDMRLNQEINHIPGKEELLELANFNNTNKAHELALVGDPLCLTSLDEGIFENLETNGYKLKRMPLSEMLTFLWLDNQKAIDIKLLEDVSSALKANSTFTKDFNDLFKIADKKLAGFAGNQGRYRYAKTIDMGSDVKAIIEAYPRYENTAMVLNLNAMSEETKAPIFEMAIDGDWDENSWSRLKSFLYYCNKD